MQHQHSRLSKNLQLTIAKGPTSNMWRFAKLTATRDIRAMRTFSFHSSASAL
jgi:hypothetical protein